MMRLEYIDEKPQFIVRACAHAACTPALGSRPRWPCDAGLTTEPLLVANTERRQNMGVQRWNKCQQLTTNLKRVDACRQASWAMLNQVLIRVCRETFSIPALLDVLDQQVGSRHPGIDVLCSAGTKLIPHNLIYFKPSSPYL